MTTTESGPAAQSGERFPKAHRLRRAAEFQDVYSRGRKKTSRSFVVFILPTERPVARFGLTTPRKLGKAHDRNRIRRRIREILRREPGGFPAGLDVVVNPRRSVLERDFQSLRAEFRSLFHVET